MKMTKIPQTKKIHIALRTPRDYAKALNGPFGLTKRELDVLGEFLEIYIKLQKKSSDHYLFSAGIRKRVSQKLNLANLNVYIARLRQKRAVVGDEGAYQLHGIFIPPLEGEAEIIFKFSANGKTGSGQDKVDSGNSEGAELTDQSGS